MQLAAPLSRLFRAAFLPRSSGPRETSRRPGRIVNERFLSAADGDDGTMDVAMATAAGGRRGEGGGRGGGAGKKPPLRKSDFAKKQARDDAMEHRSAMNARSSPSGEELPFFPATSGTRTFIRGRGYPRARAKEN